MNFYGKFSLDIWCPTVILLEGSVDQLTKLKKLKLKFKIDVWNKNMNKQISLFMNMFNII